MKLEKFNSIVLAIILSVIICFIAAGVVGTFFMYMARDKQSGIKVGQNESSDKIKEKAVYGHPIITRDSEYVMTPVEIKQIQKDKFRSIAYLSSGSYYESSSSKFVSIYRGFSYCRFNNILFYNKNTAQSHLLLNKKAVISHFYYPYDYADEKEADAPKFLLFGISDKDTGQDGVINEHDAVIGYISDLSGKELHQITPENTQLISWDLDKHTNSIYVRVRIDSDKDKTFSDKDDLIILRVDISKPDIGTEIINDKTRKELSVILN